MEGEYTRQLDALVAALRQKDAFPQWLIVIISAFLGLIVGALLEPLKLFIGDAIKRWRLRRLLYKEITWVYGELRALKAAHDKYPTITPLTVAAFEDVLRFEHYKYALSMPEVYNALEENLYVDFIYQQYKKLLKIHEEEGLSSLFLPDSPEARLGSSLRAVEGIIEKNALDIKVIEEVCPPYLKDHFRHLAFREDK